MLIKNDKEMNFNTLLAKIEYKNGEIDKLTANNNTSLIRIEELEFEKNTPIKAVIEFEYQLYGMT